MSDPRARLQPGLPPLRVGELARLTGYSLRYVQKCMECGVLDFVQPGGRDCERRIPVHAAAKLCRELGLMGGEKDAKHAKHAL